MKITLLFIPLLAATLFVTNCTPTQRSTATGAAAGAAIGAIVADGEDHKKGALIGGAAGALGGAAVGRHRERRATGSGGYYY